MNHIELPKLSKKLRRPIVWSSIGAGAVGIPGAFAAHADTPALVAIWGGLLIRLGYLAGEKIEKAAAVKIAAGVIAAVSAFAAGVKFGTMYFAYTGAGTIPAVIVNSGANATLTYLFGRSAAKVFLSDGKHDSIGEIIKSIVGLMIGRIPRDPDLN